MNRVIRRWSIRRWSIRRWSIRRWTLATLAAALFAAACGGDGTGSSAPSSSAPGKPPNILFVLVDDMAFDEMQFLPNVQRLIGDQGVTLDRAYVSVSLCCPSRTTLWRGQYSHNTGVRTNRGNGGFTYFHEIGLEESTVATWLQDAGYRTALIGKYLNDYPFDAPDNYVPPGWDTWVAPVGIDDESDLNLYVQYDYVLNDNGTLVEHGREPDDFLDGLSVDRMEAFIDGAVADDQPFFGYLSLINPHYPATPSPGDEEAEVASEAPRGPAFDEADVSDKPGWVQDFPPLSAGHIALFDGFYQQRLRSFIGIDRGVGQLLDALEANGALDDTYVVFMSDNGQHFGHHGLRDGKQTAYEEDIHVPLLVRGPGIPAGETSDDLIVNTDLAPTFTAWAGAATPDFVDGRSLVDLLASPSTTLGRQSILIEHWEEVRRSGEPPSEAEIYDPAPEYHGLRTARFTYVEYPTTGEVELYDNVEDPDQLENLATTADPELLEALSERLAALVDCEADTCRAAEDDPAPGAPGS